MVQKFKISCFINFCLSNIPVFPIKRMKNSYFCTGFSGPSNVSARPGLKNLGPARAGLFGPSKSRFYPKGGCNPNLIYNRKQNFINLLMWIEDSETMTKFYKNSNKNL